MYLKELKDRLLTTPTVLLVFYSIAVSMTVPIATIALSELAKPPSPNPWGPVPELNPRFVYIFFILEPILLYCAYPITGWLVDTIVGRSRSITMSLSMTWSGTLLCVLCYSLRCYYVAVLSVYVVTFILLCISLLLIALGNALFFTTVLSYGMDQLVYESSAKLRAFVHWLSWGYFIGFLITFLSFPTRFDSHRHQTMIDAMGIFVFGALTVSLVIHFCSGEAFLPSGRIKDSGYKVVIGVVRYALGNKYPQNRSSYSTWEQNKPSRIDLAKVQYGGPYGEEAVENTKMFGNMLTIFASSFGIYIPYALTQNLSPFIVQYNTADGLNLHGYAYDWSIAYTSFYQVFFFVVPVFELIIIPLYPKIEYFLTRYYGLLISSNVLMIASLVMMIILDVIGSYKYRGGEHEICIFVYYCIYRYKISYLWYSFVFVLTGLASALNIIGAFGFICSQAPSSFVGILTTSFWFTLGCYVVVGTLVPIPFVYTMMNVSRLTDPFWILLVQLTISCIGLIVLSLACHRYKKRAKALVQSGRYAPTDVVIDDHFDKVLHSSTATMDEEILEIVTAPSAPRLPKRSIMKFNHKTGGGSGASNCSQSHTIQRESSGE